MVLHAHILTGERQNKMLEGCTATDRYRAVISCVPPAFIRTCVSFSLLNPLSKHGIFPLAGLKSDKMAEGPRDQASVSTTADPEEDSPNMIVYRKVRPTLREQHKVASPGNKLAFVFPHTSLFPSGGAMWPLGCF